MYCLFIITFLAVYHDLKSYKIKNYIIVIGIVSGIFINCKEAAFQSIYFYLLGMILPVLILLPLFIIKALGAGDIKLFSVIGCYLGTYSVCKVIVISFLIGAILSLFYLIKNKALIKRLDHLRSYISDLKKANPLITSQKKVNIQDISILPYYEKEKHGREGVIHFSVAIFLALVVFVII